MAEKKENKLGTMPIGPLLVSMALPMMLSFFIQALYNIVDSMFVARISENALTAVSLAFPMQMIMNAIGIGTGVGISAAVPRALAQKKERHADEIANTGIFLCLCYCVMFALLGIFFAHTLYAADSIRRRFAFLLYFLTHCNTRSGLYGINNRTQHTQ